MDHHCPWLGGRCVGLHNHKYFVLFLVWTSITAIICGFAALQGLSEFVTVNSHLSEDQFRLAPLNWAFLFLVGILFGLVITGFGSYHLYLVSVNRSVYKSSSLVNQNLSIDISSWCKFRFEHHTVPLLKTWSAHYVFDPQYHLTRKTHMPSFDRTLALWQSMTTHLFQTNHPSQLRKTHFHHIVYLFINRTIVYHGLNVRN